MVWDNDPGRILTGEDQTPDNISHIFDEWYKRSREVLRGLICGRLRYQALTGRQKEFGEVGIVAALTSILAAAAPQLIAVDPLATAVILVTRRLLDDLCRQDPAGHTIG